ncbi:MAG: hypothetical protein ACT4O9_10930 [Blastocatellia bacterium]
MSVQRKIESEFWRTAAGITGRQMIVADGRGGRGGSERRKDGGGRIKRSRESISVENWRVLKHLGQFGSF